MNAGAKKEFPSGMEPLGKSVFRFSCHPGVPCYTHCCRDQNLPLYPFDIIRLKNKVGLSSTEFLEMYAMVGRGNNPFFPSVMLKMADNHKRTCSFLGPEGCTIYEERPNACRTYPLERAVDRDQSKGRPEEFYFLTNHEYCQGHAEDQKWTVKEWLRNQRLLDDNRQLDLWAEMDTLFAGNPWKGEGGAGPLQRLAFMVCYNIDAFRQYANSQHLVDSFRMDKTRRRKISVDDNALLEFGYDWLQHFLGKRQTLQPKRG